MKHKIPDMFNGLEAT